MSRAKYSYHLEQDDKVGCIVDLNGPTSVTNDIENVIEEIIDKESINSTDWNWVYQDSENMWDGFDPFTGSFVVMQMRRREDAIKEILEYRKQSQIGGCCGGGCHCG